MNRLNLIEMARKAISEEPYAEVALPSQNTVWMMGIVQLEKFAALVAAAEREACARVCEDSILAEHYLTLSEVAAAIRESPVQVIYDSMRARSKHES